MKVNVLGTSCTWFKRNNTSFLIDDKIVLDVPGGAYKDIVRNVEIQNISAILISHFHADHFEDLRVFAIRFMRENLNLSEKKKIYAPKGCLQKIIELNKILCGSKDEIVPDSFLQKIEFVDLYDGKEFEIENYKVVAYKMEHFNIETYGFVFKDKNGLIVGFSADTGMCENLHKILKDSKYAFVELSSEKKTNKHICIEEFEKIYNEYKNCKIFPVHTSDACQSYVEKQNLNALKDGEVLELV